MYNDKFKKDLQFGNDGELAVLKHLNSLTDVKLLEQCSNGDYDLKVEINNQIKTYEIKTEDQFCRPGNNSGNIFVEFECSGKPAGINRSKSDWYVFYLPHYKQIWYIETAKLKKLIETNNFPLKTNSGDGGRVKGYVIPRDKVRDSFKIYII